MSEESGSELTGPAAPQGGCPHLRRTVDLCLFAPVGVAISVVEDLPALIAKGRNRVELHLGNARVVGRYVVGRSQRTLAGHLEGLMGSGAEGVTDGGTDGVPAPTAGVAHHEPEAPAPRPAPDPAAGAVVAKALADYDTLSASQVVRRLESLGPDELRAVQRYEASTRNRRTILNRAGQLLAERWAGPAKHTTNGHEANGAGTPGAGG